MIADPSATVRTAIEVTSVLPMETRDLALNPSIQEGAATITNAPIGVLVHQLALAAMERVQVSAIIRAPAINVLLFVAMIRVEAINGTTPRELTGDLAILAGIAAPRAISSEGIARLTMARSAIPKIRAGRAARLYSVTALFESDRISMIVQHNPNKHLHKKNSLRETMSVLVHQSIIFPPLQVVHSRAVTLPASSALSLQSTTSPAYPMGVS
jgi:hypothetical protein